MIKSEFCIGPFSIAGNVILNLWQDSWLLITENNHITWSILNSVPTCNDWSKVSRIFHLSSSPLLQSQLLVSLYQFCENKQGLVLLISFEGWGPGRTGGVWYEGCIIILLLSLCQMVLPGRSHVQDLHNISKKFFYVIQQRCRIRIIPGISHETGKALDPR